MNDTMEWLANLLIEKQCIGKIHGISVWLPKDQGTERCLEIMLLLNYYNHKAYRHEFHFAVLGEKHWLQTNDLALLAFRYLHGTPDKMSYYEYVFNIACLRAGVPPHIIHTGEEQYEHILSQYGMPSTLSYLERWIQSHPQFEEMVFIGGSSDYGKQRKKYYDERRSGFNVGASPSDFSEKRGS